MVVERITAVVQYMRRTLKAQCAAVTAATLALDEDGTDPRAEAIRGQLHDMAESCRQACDKFNRLRALTGDLEVALGVKNPAFYVKPYEETGVPEVLGGKCNCGQVCVPSIVYLPALKPPDNDLRPQDGGAAEPENQGGRQPDENGPQDDAENLHAASIIGTPPPENKSA